MAKRYPKPDLVAINCRSLEKHYYAIHKTISPPQHKMDVWPWWSQKIKGGYSIECRGCRLFYSRMRIKIPFGYCGKWYFRLLMWFYLCWWKLKTGPRAWYWYVRLEMWWMHFTGKWCRWIENGRCVGCKRKRDEPV